MLATSMTVRIELEDGKTTECSFSTEKGLEIDPSNILNLTPDEEARIALVMGEIFGIICSCSNKVAQMS